MTAPPIPIGVDDFREVREVGLDYIDKSDLLRQIIDRAGVKVFLFPRPRRFGKTLNLSMIRCWFEKQDTDLTHLFEGLTIWQAGEKYRAHFQRYPVIHFNFKGSKGATFEATSAAIRNRIGKVFHEHRYLEASEKLSEMQRQSFRAVLLGTAEPSSTFRELLELYALDLQPVFESLLEGGSLEVTLDENVVLGDIRRSQGALWSLLVFSGYLKAEEASMDALGNRFYRLSIPNLEIRGVYSGTFRTWMDQRLRASGGDLAALTRALLGGDAEAFEEELQAFVTNILSYHDAGTLRPERVYHGFLLGLLAVLEPGHQVRSNRESGKGRPDVLIRPAVPGKPGVVLELKVAKPGKKTLEQALQEGLAQLQTGQYDAELSAAGASPIHRFAVAFDGKSVRVQKAPE